MVRLLISSDATTLTIQACDKEDSCSVPFMAGRTAEDLKGQKKSTTVTNRMLLHIIRTKLLPYFGKLKMSSITPQQIVRWQNELINYRDKDGAPYSPVYLKSIQNQISAIFNHAVRYYNLKENPCKKAGSMGKKKNREMAFWTKEEYLKVKAAVAEVVDNGEILIPYGEFCENNHVLVPRDTPWNGIAKRSWPKTAMYSRTTGRTPPMPAPRRCRLSWASHCTRNSTYTGPMWRWRDFPASAIS